MGHRMEFYTDAKNAELIMNISKSYNVDARIVGRVESAPVKKVTVKSIYGEFEYF